MTMKRNAFREMPGVYAKETKHAASMLFGFVTSIVCVVGLAVLPVGVASAATTSTIGNGPDVTVGGGGTPPNPNCTILYQWYYSGSGTLSPTFQTKPAGTPGSCGNIYVGGSSATEDYVGWGEVSDGQFLYEYSGSAGWVWDGPSNNNWIALGSDLTGALENWVQQGGNVGSASVWISAD